MKILAVDDDETVLDLLTESLARQGHGHIARARSGPEALGRVAAATRPFDCLLLDIQMPGMDGIALCRELRALPAYRQRPILMLTAMSQRDTIARAFLAGATDYITKPFDLMELTARIGMAQRLVQERRRVDEGQLTIERLRRELTAQPPLSLSDPLDIGGIPRSLPWRAFETYILTLARARLFTSSVLAAKLDDAARLHADHRPAEFIARLRLAGQALAEATEGEGAVLSYRGDGLFLAVGARRGRLTPADMEAHINGSLLAGQGLRISVGDRCALGALTRLGSLHALDRAAAAAERRANHAARAAPAPRSLPQRSLARYRGEQDRSAYEGMLRQMLDDDLARLRGAFNAGADPDPSRPPAPSRRPVP